MAKESKTKSAQATDEKYVSKLMFFERLKFLRPAMATTNVMHCAIWYHLYNLKNVENVAKACNFTKINTSSWVFFTLFKLCKWYQIAQRITNSRGSISTQNNDLDDSVSLPENEPPPKKRL